MIGNQEVYFITFTGFGEARNIDEVRQFTCRQNLISWLIRLIQLETSEGDGYHMYTCDDKVTFLRATRPAPGLPMQIEEVNSAFLKHLQQVCTPRSRRWRLHFPAYSLIPRATAP